MEDRLREAALAVSSAEGEKIYDSLLASLASLLGVEYALISVYVDPRQRMLRTLATLMDGRAGRNLEYPIAGTPCESAIGRAFGLFASGVRQRFPGDAMLAAHRIEGYAASTLNDTAGRPIGLVAVMSRRALANEPQLEAILKIFATRIGAEIERRRAEAELRASEEQYRAIFNAAADALVLRDAQFRIVDVNAAYEAMTGKRREEVVGLQELTATRGLDPALRAMLHADALAGKPVFFESDGRRHDGSPLVLEVRGVPMTYRGEPHVLYVGRDVTEAKLAERAQRDSWEQYRAIFDATADSLVLRDAEFRIVDVNAAYEAMSGRRREEALGRQDVTMSSPELTARIKALHARALAGERVSWEAPARRKNGESFAIEVRGVPMLHRGQPHVLYIGRDVTARQRAEAERAQLEAQLRQAQKMEAIGHLAGGIAHDFNNILQGILGNLALA
ncbi:MAG: PAS domain S-box protein, partial [Pseudomonadota bacterium]